MSILATPAPTPTGSRLVESRTFAPDPALGAVLAALPTVDPAVSSGS